MKVLQVIEQAFRTLVEEQDDTLLWLTASMRGAGAELSVLLAGNAACYAVQQHPQPALSIGPWQQREPASLIRDIGNLVQKGVPVYVLQDDLDARGLADLPLQTGVERLPRGQLPVLYENADQVWHW